MMKNILLILSLPSSFYLVSYDSVEPFIDDPKHTPISNLSFQVDTTYLDTANNRFVAKGTLKNNGSSKVTSPWYVECQFYTNSSRTTKLGGNYTQIGVPLAKNESTFWTITYSSSNMNVNDFPNFAVGNLRVIYK